MIIDFKSVILQSFPFPYFSKKNSIPKEKQINILEWMENSAPWKLIETEFYEQYEFSLLEYDFQSPISDFCSEDVINYIKYNLSLIFGVNFKDKFEVTAHKLINGQTIRIHNDFIHGQETHRLLIQLNRNWIDEYGGKLMLFNGSEPENLIEIINPESGSIQGFAISKNSHHAVSTVHGGERFTVVYSFFSEN